MKENPSLLHGRIVILLQEYTANESRYEEVRERGESKRQSEIRSSPMKLEAQRRIKTQIQPQKPQDGLCGAFRWLHSGPFCRVTSSFPCHITGARTACHAAKHSFLRNLKPGCFSAFILKLNSILKLFFPIPTSSPRFSLAILVQKPEEA
ncbi:uncharacterized protein LOC118610056 isoform X2 [Rousettus aegyptiacus]|nr:uncharacterized protein LOC118610056 isoform X2 [Rousettus aegyptiacus]